MLPSFKLSLRTLFLVFLVACSAPSEETPIANLAPSVKIINLTTESLLPDATLELRFSKGVSLTESSFEVVCSTVSQRTVVPLLFSVGLPASGVTSLSLRAESVWPSGNCVLQVIAARVTETVVVDRPRLLDGNADGFEGDDFLFSFVVTEVSTKDLAPTVISVDPNNLSEAINSGAVINFSFSEAISLAESAFLVSCETNQNVAIRVTPSLPAEGVSALSVVAETSWPKAEACSLRLKASAVSDSDDIDPPDRLDGNADGIAGDDFVLFFNVKP